MIEKQLSIYLENKPGVLAEACKALADQDINIRAMSISNTVDDAVVRLVVDDPKKSIHILGDHGAMVVETDVLAVNLTNKPGEVAALARKFARAKINIEYAYGSCNADEAKLFFRVSDVKKARQLLAPKKKKRKR